MFDTPENSREFVDKIARLKRERGAVILAHNYQIPEVQEIGDFVGDSLALSRKAAEIEAEVIVFCGVHFMAESAAILSPHKTVLLPAPDAGCPMADMVDAEGLIRKKAEHPNAAVVCYVNSSAEVKAESDICCTSSNAVKVVESLDEEEILFIPDQNLACYVASKVKHKRVIPWAGFCATHHRLKREHVEKVRELHPDALILVHPEAPMSVLEISDFVGSTSEILKYASHSEAKSFIIGTEMGILHKLKKDNPEKMFYLLSPGLVCPNMKKTTLASVERALRSMEPRITVPEPIRSRAYGALERMIRIG